MQFAFTGIHEEGNTYYHTWFAPFCSTNEMVGCVFGSHMWITVQAQSVSFCGLIAQGHQGHAARAQVPPKHRKESFGDVVNKPNHNMFLALTIKRLLSHVMFSLLQSNFPWDSNSHKPAQWEVELSQDVK